MTHESHVTDPNDPMGIQEAKRAADSTSEGGGTDCHLGMGQNPGT